MWYVTTAKRTICNKQTILHLKAAASHTPLVTARAGSTNWVSSAKSAAGQDFNG